MMADKASVPRKRQFLFCRFENAPPQVPLPYFLLIIVAFFVEFLKTNGKKRQEGHLRGSIKISFVFAGKIFDFFHFAQNLRNFLLLRALNRFCFAGEHWSKYHHFRENVSTMEQSECLKKQTFFRVIFQKTKFSKFYGIF